MHSYSHSQSVPLKFGNDYLYIVLSNVQIVITLNLAKNTEPWQLGLLVVADESEKESNG